MIRLKSRAWDAGQRASGTVLETRTATETVGRIAPREAERGAERGAEREAERGAGRAPARGAQRLAADEIAVVLIDDNRLMAEVIATMLNQMPGVRATATADIDPDRIVERAPAVVLLDVALRETDSLHLAATLKERLPDVNVVVTDLLASNEQVMDFVNAGVAGFVLKDACFDDVVRTIRTVAGGDKVLPPRLTESLFHQVAHETTGRTHEAALADTRMTRREAEVIDLIGAGLSNKEIAQRLNIATHTVKSHVRNVMDKLALHTRLQIAAYTHREVSG